MLVKTSLWLAGEFVVQEHMQDGGEPDLLHLPGDSVRLRVAAAVPALELQCMLLGWDACMLSAML
jgi:hypothetical protein